MSQPRIRALVIAAVVMIAAAGLAAVGGATNLSATATAPSNSSPPTVSGTATQGQTLTASSGSWAGSTPIAFAYKWEQCDSGGASCAFISGATSQTYTLTLADVGHTIRVVVTGSNSAGSSAATSAQTAVVTGATPPHNSSLPQISGSESVGSTLTASNGSWTGTAPITYDYLWERCNTSGASCANLTSQTKQTYDLTSSDLNHTIRVRVTATNAGGSGQATSAATGTISNQGPANTTAPAISGTLTQGKTLTVSNGTWKGATPITYSYEWQRCSSTGVNCTTISGATKSTYVLASADVGNKLQVRLSATNSAGTGHVYSNQVGPIGSSSTTPPPSGLPAGAVKLADGEISIPASSVPDTGQLLVSKVSYSPSVSHGHQPVQATFKIVDQNKYVIRGALVYVVALPYNYGLKVAELQTGQTGLATVTISPTRFAPRKGALVLFVRARTPQGNLLAGSSTRRLIQVRLSP